MLKEVTQYIEDNSSLVIGTNLFAGTAPPDIEGLIVIVENRDPGVRNPHYELRDTGQVPYRILVRGAVGAGYFTTKALADTIFSIVYSRNQVTLPIVESGSTYLVNIAASDPYYIGKDEKQRDMMVINIIVTMEEV